MKKLSLDIDTLQVESFATAPAALANTGTVRGHGTAGGDGCATDNVGSWCCWNTDTTCPGSDTWGCDDGGSDNSCLASCGEYCDITNIQYKCNNYTSLKMCI